MTLHPHSTGGTCVSIPSILDALGRNDIFFLAPPPPPPSFFLAMFARTRHVRGDFVRRGPIHRKFALEISRSSTRVRPKTVRAWNKRLLIRLNFQLRQVLALGDLVYFTHFFGLQKWLIGDGFLSSEAGAFGRTQTQFRKIRSLNRHSSTIEDCFMFMSNFSISPRVDQDRSWFCRKNLGCLV